MTQEMRWLETHIGTIDDLFVMAGDQVIFRGDSREAVEGFVYGMALAYSVIPENIFQALKKQFEEDE